MAGYYCDVHDTIHCHHRAGYNEVQTPEGIVVCCDEAESELNPEPLMTPDELREYLSRPVRVVMV